MNKSYFITNRIINLDKPMNTWIYTDNHIHVGEAEIIRKFNQYLMEEESLKFYFGSDKEILDKLFSKFKKDIIFLIHGFSTNFDQSLDNVIMLKENFALQNYYPDIVVYSWASNGKINGSDYLDDQADARKSAMSISYVFEYIKNNLKDKKVNLLAHSMGNFTLKNAFQEYKQNNQITKIFNNICLIEADENYNTFEDSKGMKGLDKLANKISIFYNHNDWILKYSDWAFRNNLQRLGFKGPKSIDNLPKNIDLLDVTEDVERNQHGYIYKNNEKIFKKLTKILKD